MARFADNIARKLDRPLRDVASSELKELASAFCAAVQHHEPAATIARAEVLIAGLTRSRLFDDAATCARTVEDAGLSSSLVTKLRLQSLIDSGKLGEAQREMTTALRRIPPSDPEHLEIRGLAGRLAKQRFVNEEIQKGRGNATALRDAIDRYLAAYDENDAHPAWHGINAVALLARAQRDGVRHPAARRLQPVAQSLLREIEARNGAGKADFWDIATAAEAELALGNTGGAELWLRRYVDHPDTSSFSVASTLRQLREVWRLTVHGTPGSALLPILERKLAGFGAMSISMDAHERYSDQQSFERVFGNAGFVSFGKYRTGLARAAAVCRVENSFGEPQGTGFLVKGRDLGSNLPDEMVLLTNAHVVSPDYPNAMAADKARFVFYGLPPDARGRTQKQVCAAREMLWTSRPAMPPTAAALDTTIIRLKGKPPKVDPYPLAGSLPVRGDGARVFIIGHPGGGGLSFSLNDNELIDYDHAGPRVHYRTPTEGGSSGSPVFNDDWELVAIHHAGESDMQSIDGRQTYEANEGIWIQSVRFAIRSNN